MSYSFLFKYIIIGDSGVGKSCLLLQYTDSRYRDKHEVTIGVEFGGKIITLGENKIKLQIWDTAGQQAFQGITRGYYRNAIGAIICYDVCNKNSFEHVAKWLEQAQLNGPSHINLILVGNKSDRESDRVVSFQQGVRLASEKNIPFIETSAKNGRNVEKIFKVLTENTLKKIEEKTIEVKQHPGIKIGKQKYIAQQSNFDQNIVQDQYVRISEKPNAQNNNRCCGGKKNQQ